MGQTLVMTQKSIEGNEKAVLMEVEGAIDSATTPEFERVVNDFIGGINKPGYILILDFAKLSYINSTGLTKLMTCYMNMLRRGGVLKIINVAKNINEILTIVGAVKVIKVCKDLNEALGK